MPQNPAEENLVSLLRDTAHRIPDRPAIIDAKDQGFPSHSFAQLYVDTQACASILSSQGLGKGDKSLLFVKPGYELIVLAFALIHLGAVPIIIDPGMGLQSMLACIRSTRPSFLVGTPLVCLVSTLFPRSFKTIQGKVVIDSRFLVKTQREKVPVSKMHPAKTSPSELAAIVFTSGSTGKPKGVRYLHSTFNAQVESLRENFGMSEGELDLTTLPVFALFNPALGITSVIPDMNPRKPAQADPEKLVRAIMDFKISSAFASPVIGKKIANWCLEKNQDLPSLKRIFLAGAPSPPSLIEKLSKVLINGQVIVPYGSTEALPVAYCKSQEVKTCRTSIESGEGSLLGKPIPGITIKIFPARNAPYPSNSHELNVLDKNEVGEICVSGAVVTDGYYRMPGATFDAKFDFEGKVFHRMGDLGYFDQDDNLRFMGRKIECIPTPNGPLETERCEPIVNAYDEIYRSALVGIGLGALREPCLVVEPVNKSSMRANLEKNIRKDLRKRMPAFAVERIFWENSIPVDSRHNAKIHRLALSRKWTRLVAQKPKLGLPG